MLFSSIGLSAELLRAIADQGYTEPTPVQARTIPAIMDGEDVIAGAQTGTGKTAAFTLPMLHQLAARSGNRQRQVRALILTPTRELASQVGDSVRTYGKYLPLKSAVVFGGVGINPQIKALRQGVDILIATPGRLLDHLERGTVDLSAVEIVVLDEADRMLDMGFIHDIERILKRLPSQRQSLLFSATYPDSIKKLSHKYLNNPKMIEVARRSTAAEAVDQSAIKVDRDRKRELLSFLIGSQDWQQVLVFTRTKRGADRLARQMEKDGIDATAIHGDKSQGARTRALKAFKRNQVRVLVATDVAARGLDINQLPHVVNYELPDNAEDYVHRIGRTGRGGNSGSAISLVSNEEQPQWSAIERLIKNRISASIVEGFEPQQKASPQTRKPQAKPRPNQARKGARSADNRPPARHKRRRHQSAQQTGSGR
jgi:ATP-dependent RNA helicase RhlE